MKNTLTVPYSANNIIANHNSPNDLLFTKRETEILYFTINGLTIKEIAGKLYVSDNTVANHRKNMLKKTGAKNVVSLISFAIKNSII